MAQFYNIKYLKEVEGLSQRQIATKFEISLNTVELIHGYFNIER